MAYVEGTTSEQGRNNMVNTLDETVTRLLGQLEAELVSFAYISPEFIGNGRAYVAIREALGAISFLRDSKETIESYRRYGNQGGGMKAIKEDQARRDANRKGKK